MQKRSIKISHELVKILSKVKRNKNRLFTTYYNEPFTKNKLARLVNEFRDKSNFPMNWALFDLRHSYAVNFLADGGDIRELQATLGHDNVFTTKQLYGEALTQKIRETLASPYG